MGYHDIIIKAKAFDKQIVAFAFSWYWILDKVGYLKRLITIWLERWSKLIDWLFLAAAYGGEAFALSVYIQIK
jgi:hypothetical protein